jgi:glycine/D-amino acid oxidase-like deaminating enzyme
VEKPHVAPAAVNIASHAFDIIRALSGASMDLKSGYPWWAVKNGLMHVFPALREDLRCDVVVIGAGITGALIADELQAHGHEVAVLDQRDAGWGSTSASTALLQYEIDTHMVDLAKDYGEDAAVLAYRSCADAIDLLAEKAASVRDVDFARMSSLYYASRKRHAGDLREEFDLRRRHGFEVEWLESDAARERFGFRAPAAILSAKAARVDPYRMAYRLLARLQRGGGRVHDRTPVARIAANRRGVELETTSGARVRARHLVLAAGYASQQFLRKRVAKNRSSYAFITDPIEPAALGALANTMVWESARPYLYLRTTGDGRLLVGGDDDNIDVAARRDALVDRKAAKLADKVRALFPDLPVVPAFAWAGTFAETKDGLPWFGAHPQHGPRVLFAMAYGGNGITYSMLGAGLLRALVERRRHPLQAIFGFGR